MLSVLVGNLKGGCGKTTLATHIAAAFAGGGHAVALADCDRQRSSLGWLERRPDTSPRIHGFDWVKKLGEVPKGIKRLVIDAPAAMHHDDVEALMGIADMVVVPVLPGAFDEDATARFLDRLAKVKAVRKNKRVVAVVGNRLRLGTKASAQLDGFFGSLGFPVVARLRDSQAYPSCAATGSCVLEARDKRSRELAAEWAPLLKLFE